ncbi:unnamed protein product [Kluyveromyces dobzhanskii CBS 2104]|uniref:BRO domain-containing protein 1 n=1 Tax=Kluyveromyces dobzhanskii CBS 2104 TaxID=1427455 RepID=A0A0A8LAB1_9SACH|nr:unnamed protein product [Kluyveromyces dobzhanskii CBS 2104]
MKTVLLPLKIKDTENVNWTIGLVNYLKKSYGSSQWSIFYDEDKTKAIDACRTTANSDLAPESLLEQNYKYAAILEQIYLRLGAHSSSLKIEFTWYEAEYRSGLAGKKFKQHTVVFEKSSIMYNIGVLLSQIAKKKMADDYKGAIPYLNRAMACFSYMSNNFLNSPSIDCAAENTSFLATLSHAEAQELFLLTLVNGPDACKRASLISKLAHTTMNLYAECENFYDQSSTNFGSSQYGEETWKDIITFKVHLYRAITTYNHMKVLEETHKVGEAIAYGKIAAKEIKEAVSYKTYVNDEIDPTGLKTIIDETVKSLTKDNDFIYNDAIPASVSIENIKTMDAVKPVTWEEQLSGYIDGVADLCNGAFKGIVPMEVYENESIYSEEKASLLRKEVDNADTADWEYQSFIEFTDLPKLVKDLETKYANGSNGSLNDPQFDLMKQQIRSWASVIQTSKFKNVSEQMQTIVNKRNEILSMLSSISADQRDNALKIKTSLLQASQSDDKIFASINPYLEEINLLTNNQLLWKIVDKLQIKSNEPSLLDLDDSKNQQILKILDNIKENQDTLRLLKEERSRNLKDFKASLNKDDITQKLILHTGRTKKEMKAVFEEELNKFKPLSTRIEATIFKQKNMINDTKIKLNEVFELTGVQDTTLEQKNVLKDRQEFFSKIEAAYSQFTTYSSDLPKGLSFYETLFNMTKDLSVASSGRQSFDSVDSNLLPPNVPQKSTQSTTFTESFAKLSLNSGANSGLSHIPENAAAKSGAPQLPPKPPSIGTNDLLSEQKPRSGSTSFYNNPSVFDEDLYSKFSK